jgi:hypothetical protein
MNQLGFFYCSLLVLQGNALKFRGKFIVSDQQFYAIRLYIMALLLCLRVSKYIGKPTQYSRRFPPFYIQGHIIYLFIYLLEIFKHISVYTRSSAAEHVIALFKITERFVV